MFRLLELPHDLLLHLLLHHFTVQEVIQIRCLCHELYDLVHYCLGRRRSLKLFFSFADVQAYTQLLYDNNLESDPVLRLHPRGPSSDELILNQHQFLNPLVDLLVDELFSNVTHLIIYFGYTACCRTSTLDVIRFSNLIEDNVTHLISRMRTTLTGLSLFGFNRSDSGGRRTSRRLLHSINKLDNLRRLDLCVQYLFLCTINEHDAYLDGEIVQHEPAQTYLVLEPKLLNKLEQISVRFGQEKNGPQFCRHSFGHLGTNLSQLVMHQLYAWENEYVSEPLWRHLLIGRSSALSTSSITHLKLTQHLSSLLPKVLPRFTGLKSLDLVNCTFSKEERPMSLLELFGLLAQFCPQLTELKLSKFTLGWVRVAEQSDLPQLEHIKHLVLKCGQKQHYFDLETKLEDENIPFGQFLHVFTCILPNLERLHIKSEPSWFHHYDSVETLSIMPRLRMLSIGYYSGFKFTCHQLLSAQYRKRYIRECGDGWTELAKQWELYCKDLEGV